MQQSYKKDVVKRFCLYFGAGLALQLEGLPIRKDKAGKNKVRDYSGVLPVITIVWMADDRLKTKEDFISYRLLPNRLANFIKNQELWKSGNTSQLLKKRAELLRILNYNAKNLDFLQKNQLVFVFQTNI